MMGSKVNTGVKLIVYLIVGLFILLPTATILRSGEEVAAAEKEVTTPTPTAAISVEGKPTPEPDEPGEAEPPPSTSETPKLSRSWPQEILELEEIVVTAATEHDLDLNLLAALIRKESWFSVEWCPFARPDLWGDPGSYHYQACETAWRVCPDGPCAGSCTSLVGALGPAQVMPYHFNAGEDGRDPMANILRGAQLLRSYIDRKDENIRLGLAAYNCGPNTDAYDPGCLAYADDILNWYEDAKSKSGKWQLPVRRNGRYPILSSNDQDHAERCPIEHAWDLTAPYGTPIYPTRPGTVVVTSCQNEDGYGCWIEVDHGDGIHSRYCHLIQGSFGVSVDDVVNKNTVLGQIGWTGITSFGPHLHFEFLRGGVRQPPADFLGSPAEIGLEYEKLTNTE